MAHETRPQDSNAHEIIAHDHGHGDIRKLEEALYGDMAVLTESTPDPLAPIEELEAHSFAWERLRSNAEIIDKIREAREHEQKSA